MPLVFEMLSSATTLYRMTTEAGRGAVAATRTWPAAVSYVARLASSAVPADPTVVHGCAICAEVTDTDPMTKPADSTRDSSTLFMVFLPGVSATCIAGV